MNGKKAKLIRKASTGKRMARRVRKDYTTSGMVRQSIVRAFLSLFGGM